jgi:flagellar basal-body rod protein FlgF
MDRLVHTALNSISNLRDQRVASANNLANMNVPGFRRDLPNEGRAFFIEGQDSLTSRAMQLEKARIPFPRARGF